MALSRPLKVICAIGVCVAALPVVMGVSIGLFVNEIPPTVESVLAFGMLGAMNVTLVLMAFALIFAVPVAIIASVASRERQKVLGRAENTGERESDIDS